MLCWLQVTLSNIANVNKIALSNTLLQLGFLSPVVVDLGSWITIFLYSPRQQCEHMASSGTFMAFAVSIMASLFLPIFKLILIHGREIVIHACMRHSHTTC